MSDEFTPNPYTHEELAAIRKQLEEKLLSCERENPGIRPLPPLTEEEASDLLLVLLDMAMDRPLTNFESFLSGQLLVSFRMAIEARMLGHRDGRYYVISEADILAKRRRP